MPELANKNVYILGAGFSAGAGAPLIHDFLDKARDLYESPTSRLDEVERRRFASAFDFRRKMAQSREKINIDLDNIEHLFGLVEMSYRLGDANEQTRYDTVYLIAKTLELATAAVERRSVISFKVNRDLYQANVRPPRVFTESQHFSPPEYRADIYDFFAALVAGQLDDPAQRQHREDIVVTFNYDLVLDSALKRLGMTPHYCLREASVPISPNGSVSLLKLHGSCNWGICLRCSNVIVLEDKVTVLASRFRDRRCENCNREGSFQPLLIPPSWDKNEYREIIKPVWQTAVRALKDASRICIIGYSMPGSDAFFQYLITLALAENHRLHKLIVVDNGQALQTKYDKILDPLFASRRFAYFGDRLENFLGGGAAFPILGRGELTQGGNISRY